MTAPLARALKTWEAALSRGCPREPRIQFLDAVPAWSDRFDLRRRFRRAARAAMSERKAEMTAVLRGLSAGNVALVDVIPGPRCSPGARCSPGTRCSPRTRRVDKIIEFADGTRLLLGIRRDGDALDRLRSRSPAWLADVQPCFGNRWFWLSFTPADRPVPVVDVLTTVSPAPRAPR